MRNQLTPETVGPLSRLVDVSNVPPRGLDVRVEATPNKSWTLISPSPRISMWCCVSSGHEPMTNDCARHRSSTASSATSNLFRVTSFGKVRPKVGILFPEEVSWG